MRLAWVPSWLIFVFATAHHSTVNYRAMFVGPGLLVADLNALI